MTAIDSEIEVESEDFSCRVDFRQADETKRRP
jgi:hypothetical protein